MAKKKSGLLKNLVALVIIAGALAFVYDRYQKRQRILRENEAVEHYDEGRYDQAIAIYVELLPKSPGADLERVKTQLGKCYKAKGDDPGLSIKGQVELYKKALKYDPEAVQDERLLKLVKSTE